jgi:membrane protein DedA with SNARE-associated domain/rhodanese-related sulfurtransferase
VFIEPWRSMHQIIQLIHQYGVLAVCVSVLLEDSGLPFPSYPVLMLASAFTLTSLTAPLVLIAAVAAAICADTIWYFAGARLGPRIMRMVGRMSFSSGNSVRRTHSWFGRVGPWALLMVKFLPGIALATIVFCGVTRLRLSRFLIFDAIGSAIYLALPLVLGRVFHHAIAAMLIYFARFGQIGAVIVVALLVPYVITRLVVRRALIRKLAAARVSAEQLMQMSGNPAGPVILEIRGGKEPHSAGSIPGALPVNRSGIAAAVKQVPRSTEIVIYAPAADLRLELIAARVLEKAGFKKIRPLRGGLKAWIAAGCPVEFRRPAEPETARSAVIVPFPCDSVSGERGERGVHGPRKVGPRLGG